MFSSSQTSEYRRFSELPVIPLVVVVSLVFSVVCIPGDVEGTFDPTGWKWFRTIEVKATDTEELVAFALPSAIIEKCREDFEDIRLVDFHGSPVPIYVRHPIAPVLAEPFPAKVFRLERKPGMWTDIWVDKTGKVLTQGVRIDTSSSGFIRKVELRGSDNIRDQFVLRMDGIIAVIEDPIRLRSLDVKHPLSNFQYYHIRIIDDRKPAIHIESIRCYPPSPSDPLTEETPARIVENRPNSATGKTFVVIDLGEDRYPLVGLSVSTETESFIKQVAITSSNRYSAETWQTCFEGSMYRKPLGNLDKEELKVTFSPQTNRYYGITFTGAGSPAVDVSSINVVLTKPAVVFNPGTTRLFKLYYGNESADRMPKAAPRSPEQINSFFSSNNNVLVGRETRNIVRRSSLNTSPPATKESSGPFRTTIWIVGMTAFIILVFGVILVKRLSRRRRYR